jgi:hypothetical protein
MENARHLMFERFLVHSGRALRSLFLFALCPANRFLTSLFPALLLGAAYFGAAMLPKSVYTNEMPADLYIFLDGAYRVVAGDLPHIDFISTLGALNFAGPAYLQSLGLAPLKAFVAFNMSLVVLALVLAAYVVYTRLSVFTGLCLLFYLASLVAAPNPLGLAPDVITFAMFYNRFGWALVIILALLGLKPGEEGGGGKFLDGLVAGAILALLFYIKITYLAAALMILGAGALLGLIGKRTAPVAFAVFLLAVGLVEMRFPGITSAYIDDMAHASSAAKDLDLKVVQAYGANLWTLLAPVLTFAFASALAGKNFFSKTTIYIACLSLIAFFIVVYNWELVNLPLAICGYIFAFQVVLNREDCEYYPRSRNFYLILAAMTLMIPWMAETIERQSSFRRYVIDSLVYKYYTFEPDEKMDGVLIEGGGLLNLDRIDKDGFVKMSLVDLRDLNMMEKPRKEIFPIQYAYTVSEGAKLLEDFFADNPIGPLMVMDFSNPFTMMFELPTPRGTYLWFHSGKNFSAENPVEPRKVFANVQYLMNPRFPIYHFAKMKIWEGYRGYIEKNYSMVRREPLWEIWQKKTASD